MSLDDSVWRYRQVIKLVNLLYDGNYQEAIDDLKERSGKKPIIGRLEKQIAKDIKRMEILEYRKNHPKER